MKQKTSKEIKYWSSVAIVGLVLGLSIQFVQAWTEPTATAPGGNLGAPINTGTIAQDKAAQIGVTKGGPNDPFNGWGGGAIKIGSHTLNSNTNGWLYLGDQNNGVYGGKGLAMANLWVNSKAFIGSTDSDYNPSASDWNYTLQLNGSNSTSIGFHDAGASVSSVKYNNSGFTIGADDGWGTKPLKLPSILNCDTIDTDASGTLRCGSDASGGSGTVTSVATNNGLTGGVITSTGTVGLNVNGISSCTNAATSKIYWDGTKLVCGTDASGSGGDNLGNHVATQTLNMNNNVITRQASGDFNTVELKSGNDLISFDYGSYNSETVFAALINGGAYPIQKRGSMSCSPGQAIRIIGSDGIATCVDVPSTTVSVNTSDCTSKTISPVNGPDPEPYPANGVYDCGASGKVVTKVESRTDNWGASDHHWIKITCCSLKLQ